jgi:hypothetical protein
MTFGMGAGIVAQGHAALRGSIESTFQDRPLYRVRLEAGVGGFIVFSPFAVVEAAQYARITDRLAALGWGPTLSFPLRGNDGKDYVAVRVSAARAITSTDGLRHGLIPETLVEGANARWTSGTSGNSWLAGIKIIASVAQFFVEVQAEHVRGTRESSLQATTDTAVTDIFGTAIYSVTHGQAETVARTSVTASISVLLNALMTNDALRLEGAFLRFNDGSRSGGVLVEQITTFRAAYEFRF